MRPDDSSLKHIIVEVLQWNRSLIELTTAIKENANEIRRRLRSGESTGEPALDFAVDNFAIDQEMIEETRRLFSILNHVGGQWVVIRESIGGERLNPFDNHEPNIGSRTILAQLANPAFTMIRQSIGQNATVILNFTRGVAETNTVRHNGIDKLEQISLNLRGTTIRWKDIEIIFDSKKQIMYYCQVII